MRDLLIGGFSEPGATTTAIVLLLLSPFKVVQDAVHIQNFPDWPPGGLGFVMARSQHAALIPRVLAAVVFLVTRGGFLSPTVSAKGTGLRAWVWVLGSSALVGG
jgi:hypothetical protein